MGEKRQIAGQKKKKPMIKDIGKNDCKGFLKEPYLLGNGNLTEGKDAGREDVGAFPTTPNGDKTTQK